MGAGIVPAPFKTGGIMKKLFLVLALLIIGSFASQGAFALTYPSCYNGGNVNNGTNKDRFNVKGWCIDDYGVLQPRTDITVTSTQPNSQGGMAVPVVNIAGPYTTYDSLIAQQTGSYITDMGGQTSPSATGTGGVYILPTAAPGLIYFFTVGSNSTITVDTLTTADTILYASGTAGYGIKNSSKASGDSLVIYSSLAGKWAVEDHTGTWVTEGGVR